MIDKFTKSQEIHNDISLEEVIDEILLGEEVCPLKDFKRYFRENSTFWDRLDESSKDI